MPLTTTSTMASEGTFNELIHAPMRLRICGLLRSVQHLDFGVLRDTLDVSDPTLSKHLKVLRDAGFVTIEKQASRMRTDARRLTQLSLTTAGVRAFDGHVAAMHRITTGDVPRSDSSEGTPTPAATQ